jgi:hypothetical protein
MAIRKITTEVPSFTVAPEINTTTFPEDIDQYNLELPDVIAAQQSLSEEQNNMATDMDTVAAEVEANALIASGSANNHGAWSSLTGSFPIGEAVNHNNSIWVSNIAIADITASEPTTSNTDWTQTSGVSQADLGLKQDLTAVHDAASKASIVDADEFGMQDSEDTYLLKKVTWLNIISTVISSLGAKISALTSKTTPVDADSFVIADSAVSNASKKLTLTNLKAMIFTDSTLTGTPTAPTATAGTNNTQIATTAYVDGKFVLEETVTASGTSVDFTSIPNWAKRINVMFNGISTSGTSIPIIRIGTSGGLQTTAYRSVSQASSQATQQNTGYGLLHACVAGNIYDGNFKLTLQNSSDGTWTENGALSSAAGTVVASYGSGVKTLSGTLDRLSITTVSGTDTFDSGTINISYEG